MKDLTYLMTSEFNDGLTPEEFKDLLIKFRYEYRLLSGKNSSFEKHIDKLTMELDNLKKLLIERDNSNLQKIANVENELNFTMNKLNKKLSFKERIIGKLDRNDKNKIN